MDAGLAVRGRRALEEHEVLTSLARLERSGEDVLVVPARQHLLLEYAGQLLGRQRTIVRHRRIDSGHRRSRTPRTSAPRWGSARDATAMISSSVAGSRASGRHRSVRIEIPSTRIPAWTATMTSGTVDMPTTSAPALRSMRYSARVSRFGPVTATYTPSRRISLRSSQ